jgi:hypothetical protein
MYSNGNSFASKTGSTYTEAWLFRFLRPVRA